MKRTPLRGAVTAAAAFLSLFAAVALIADNVGQTLPFSQAWTDTGLITTSDDWSGVAGITGYRGDGLVASTGVDPQTVTADGTAAPTAVVDVNANQTTPNTFTTGGVAEFHITDPVVALQGSGTADAPFLLASVVTTGLQSITVAYNLRDVDGSADNAVQPVALQFRVGSSGSFTNVPAGFVSDASTGPSLATLVTAVSAVLPAAANNQPLVQIRVITTDAVGSDEWIGVDDIQVTGSTVPQPTNPSGVGSATPGSVLPGANTTLNVTVTPGTNPTSTALAVTGDLSSIGGSATQALLDNGASGDGAAGDNVFGFVATVSGATTPGNKSLPISITDGEGRSGSTSIALTVLSPVVGSPDIVISEFRVRGPSGGNDEFVEIYNLSANPVSIAGWRLRGSNNTGTAVSTRATVPPGVVLPAGCHYLFTNSAANGYSGTTPGNVTYGTGIADDGGLAIAGPVGNDTPVDQVGMSNGSAFKEGTPLANLGSSNLNRSYERKPGGASGSGTDTDNNASDFQLITPSDPQAGVVPFGIGSANPPSVLAGDSSLLTVAVTPACNSTNTGTTVVVNLSSIGGSPSQSFFDDGSNGDAAIGDGTYSYLATVTPSTTAGSKTLPVTITDSGARVGTASLTLGVQPAPVEIFEIQGSGLASPFVGTTLTTRDNIVTGVGPNGFFIQTPDARADANVETSNGVFVFTSSAPTVAVGAQVDVTATVSEFFNMTELDSPTVTVDSTGNTLPAVVLLDSTKPSPNQPRPANEMERFEGMLVRVENGVATGPSNQFDEVSIVASSNRTFREPGILFPGLPGLPVWDGNPEIFEIEPSGLGLPNVLIPGGAAITVAEGPLAFAFGDYQIWPSTLTVAGTPEVVPVRDRVAGEFTVGSQNVLRLFDLIDDPDKDDETPTAPAYANRLAKFSLLIRNALKAPDVLTVQEAENLTVLQDLAAKIATDDPAIVYTPYLLEGNDIGGIDIGFLVRDTVQVDTVLQFGKDDTWTFNAETQLLNDRPPLVLQGSYVGGTVPFPIVVIGVHQRSLSGIDGNSAGAQRVRAKRHEQALRLSQYLQSLQEADPDIRLTVAGDFNSFEFTDGYVDVMGQVTGNPDPAGALIPATDEVDPNLTNQTLNMPADERYSFIFDGSAQSLDHAVTSSAMDFWVRDVQHARGNSDGPAAFDDDPTTALRASDHDGTVLFVMGDDDGDGFPDDGDSCVSSSTDATVIIDGCDSGAENDLFANGCKISDTIEACAAAAVTHEDFTACVTQAMNTLKNSGAITNKERGAIQKCAGQADIP